MTWEGGRRPQTPAERERTLRHYQALADEAWCLTNPWTPADDKAFHAWAHGTDGPPDDVWGEGR